MSLGQSTPEYDPITPPSSSPEPDDPISGQTPTREKFACQFCRKSFTTKSNLVAHQNKTRKCLIIQGKVKAINPDYHTTAFSTSSSSLNLNDLHERLDQLESIVLRNSAIVERIFTLVQDLKNFNQVQSYLNSGILPPARLNKEESRSPLLTGITSSHAATVP